ncbi:efflux RND transporter permease subunit, partial [Pseudomonas viridiflava]
IKRLRDQLYGLSGVDQVELYGLQDERIYLDFDHQTLGASGLAPQQVLQQLQGQNAIALGGNPVVGEQSTTLSVSGEILSLEQLRRFPVQLASGERVPLQSLAKVSVAPVDPPETAAIYQGQS